MRLKAFQSTTTFENGEQALIGLPIITVYNVVQEKRRRRIILLLSGANSNTQLFLMAEVQETEGNVE